MAREGFVARFLNACAVAASLAVVAACGGGGDGDGLPEGYPTPVLVRDTLRFVALETSQWHTCGVALDGSTWCWGADEYGELGVPGTSLGTCEIPGIALVPCTGTPQLVSGAPTFTSLSSSLGANHTCGLSTSGAAWCWGRAGQLGDGRNVDRVQPVAVAGDLSFAMLRSSTSGLANCALTASNEGWCWGPGRDLFGDGVAGAPGAWVPVRVDWGHTFVAFDLGELHACGLTASGGAWCWGHNWYGQLGVGSAGGSGALRESTIPLQVVGGHVFRHIATGSDHTCALDDSGAAWCWGVSSALGSAPSTPGYFGTPQRVAGGHLFASIVSGQLHTCGLTASGEAWCWGQNYYGELGDGTRSQANVPVRVQTSVRFSSLVHRATCGLTAEGQAWCWGNNAFGQVGRRSPFER